MTGLPPRPVSPELLAPARDAQCLRAAVENGADAVYFGLNCGFHARARAAGIAPDALPDVMAWLHGRQVKGYLTLNTLVFSGELQRIESMIRLIAVAGTDAVIVQDLGVARLVRAVCPDLPIHASTQMSLSSAEGIKAVEPLGISRVILARELSLEGIAEIARHTTMALEVFVHGALCIAYSGQCLTSHVLGGRSANRGQCAQPCRLPYELVCDGKDLDLADRKYLFSPRDLGAYDLIPQLIEAGISAVKIEGRLKDADYVAAVTRHYRKALDDSLTGQHVPLTSSQTAELELSFSRGFSTGWLLQPNAATLVPGSHVSHRGVLVGHVAAVKHGRVTVRLCGSIQRGDGVAFARNANAMADSGGRIFEIFRDRRSTQKAEAPAVVELTFGRGVLDLSRLRPGQSLWKTDDPKLTARLRKTYQTRTSQRRIPIDLTIDAEAGRPLSIIARLGTEITCHVQSPAPLAAALKHPLTADLLAEQCGRLGGTNYQLRTLEARIVGTPMVPLSTLGKLRHELVRQLDEASSRPPHRQVSSQSVLPFLLAQQLPSPLIDLPKPALHVLCRSLDQVRTVLGLGLTRLLVELDEVEQCREAVEIARTRSAQILLATPRMHKPGETAVLQSLLDCRPAGLLARNLASAAFCVEHGLPWVADFSLHAANELTVHYLRQLGAERTTVPYDVGQRQLLDLVRIVPPSWLEAIVYSHPPLFHTEYCLFTAALAEGKKRPHCHRPCRHHQVQVRDRLGVQHVLKADALCRNTLFHGQAQSNAEAMQLLIDRGVRDFRVELLDEKPADVASLLERHRQLLCGE